jgi:hypothetical protein
VVDVSLNGVLPIPDTTLDGTGTNGYVRFGGLHNDICDGLSPDTQKTEHNPLVSGIAPYFMAGLLQMPITGK